MSASQSFNAYNVEDFRQMARRRLPRGIFEYIDRGAEDEIALANNRAAYERIKLLPHVAVDVSSRDTSTELFGQKIGMPFGIAPTAAAGLLWFEGELELAKAAAKANVPFTLATGSMTSMERIAKEAGGRLWFQLYLWAQRHLSYELVDRAASQGFEALVVTVDTAVAPNREHNKRNGFALPFILSRKSAMDMCLQPGWLVRVLLRYIMKTGFPRYENFPAELQTRITKGPPARRFMRADSLTWSDIEELRRRWPGKLVVKGILRPDDAIRAVESGADAVQISNHGGRNVDSAPAPIEVLPEIAAAVAGRVPLLIDSGVRRGSDIAKAVSLGAAAVFAGRPPLYGIAVGGQAGADMVLALFREELDRIMGQTGCTSIRDLGPDMVSVGRHICP